MSKQNPTQPSFEENVLANAVGSMLATAIGALLTWILTDNNEEKSEAKDQKNRSA